jgi:hypothetical protein
VQNELVGICLLSHLELARKLWKGLGQGLLDLYGGVPFDYPSEGCIQSGGFGPFSSVAADDDDCFYYHSWRNNVIIAFGTLSSFLT